MEAILKWIESLKITDDDGEEEKRMSEEEFLQFLSNYPTPGASLGDVNVVAIARRKLGLSRDEAREYLRPHSQLLRAMGYRVNF